MKITQLVAGILLALSLSHAVHGAEETAPPSTSQLRPINEAFALIKNRPGRAEDRTFGCPICENHWSTTKFAIENHLRSSKHYDVRMNCEHCGQTDIRYSTWYDRHRNRKCVSAGS